MNFDTQLADTQLCRTSRGLSNLFAPLWRRWPVHLPHRDSWSTTPGGTCRLRVSGRPRTPLPRIQAPIPELLSTLRPRGASGAQGKPIPHCVEGSPISRVLCLLGKRGSGGNHKCGRGRRPRRTRSRGVGSSESWGWGGAFPKPEPNKFRLFFGTRTSGWEMRDNAGSLMALSHTPQPLGNGHPTSSRQHEIEIW